MSDGPGGRARPTRRSHHSAQPGRRRDLERGRVRVFGQLQAEPGRPRGEGLVVNERPKWGSDRTIGLPPETSFVLEALRAQRQRQRLERIAAGSGW